MSEAEQASQQYAPSLADIETILRDLLVRFQHSGSAEPEQIARIARAGAEAILVQIQHRPWVSSAETAAMLGVSEPTVRKRVQQRQLPAVRGADAEPRIHRRDLSLYQMTERLGATEEQITPLTPPVAWSDEFGADPRHDLTPG